MLPSVLPPKFRESPALRQYGAKSPDTASRITGGNPMKSTDRPRRRSVHSSEAASIPPARRFSPAIFSLCFGKICTPLLHCLLLLLYFIIRRLHEIVKRYFKTEAIRAIASSVRERSPNAVRRKKPSPFSPKPAPGVPTTCGPFSRKSKNSHESMPFGQESQI